jgi:hypothetical protein
VPEEIWSGRKPSISYLKVFGSFCFRHIPDQKRRKLEDKGESMVLIGHDPTGAYRLFDPLKQKVVISRDVIFVEIEF